MGQRGGGYTAYTAMFHSHSPWFLAPASDDAHVSNTPVGVRTKRHRVVTPYINGVTSLSGSPVVMNVVFCLFKKNRMSNNPSEGYSS